MAAMGKYCKAYSIKTLRQFEQWSEKLENIRTEKQQIDGQEVEVQRVLTDDDFLYLQERVLTDDDFLYLQENYVVTDGIFKDENIIFDNVTPEWQKFCQQNLGFRIPDYQTLKV